MAIIPFTALAAGTARAVAAEGAAGVLANLVLDQFCQDSDDVEEWEAAQRAGIDGAIARSVQPITRALRAQYCPLAPPPARPLQISAGQYGVGGASFGTVAGYSAYINTDNGNQRVVSPLFQEAWGCQDNRGLPVTAPRELFIQPEPNGSKALFVRMRREDNSEYEQPLTPAVPGKYEAEYQVVEFNVRPCNSAIIPIIPPHVRLPERPGNPPPIPRPEFPITINIPGGVGFPPIPIPIVYAPITPSLSLSPRLTFAPTIELPGLPDIAPPISIDLGGISIGEGGDITISDIESIINEAGGGGECPDPCEPVDYAAIAQIVFEELDLKFPPGRPVGSGFTDYEAADSRQIVLPPFATSIDITVTQLSPDITTFGGGSNSPAVALCGWYSFGDNTTVGAREPLSYIQSSLLVPKGARGFSYTLKGESLATVRVNFLTATEPPSNENPI